MSTNCNLCIKDNIILNDIISGKGHIGINRSDQ